ncbi:MAG: DcaP family trimeric outer membrane transporter [Paracoccaceae bacterium]
MRNTESTGRRIAVAAALVVLGITPAAYAQSSLQAKVDALNARVSELETQQSGTVRTSPGVTLTFGGYVKFDFIYDVDEALGDTFGVSGISTTGADHEHFRTHARQTRLFFKTESTAGGRPLMTNVEFDFFGGGGNEIFSNSYNPRLRHAYVKWGNWTVGQTWTNFMPIEVYPSTVDFEGPAGIPFVRQAQVRYTTQISENVKVAFSLENSEFSGRSATTAFSESTGTGIKAGLDQLPDFVASATYSDDWGLVKVAGVVRELNSPTSGDSTTGYGINVSGQANLWQGGSVVGSFTYGDGIGRYIINGATQDAFVGATGKLTTIEAYGVTVGVSQQLTDNVKGGLAFGYYSAEDTFAPTDVDNLTTVHASLFWSPAERITVGGEVIWGQREDVSGASDDALRLQTSFQYSF